MTNQELLDAGYKRWNPSSYTECCTDLFQKCVSDDYGKRYFINIFRWDFSRYERKGFETAPRYEAEVQFTHKNGQTVDSTCYNGWELEDIEKYYADLWALGWFKYYEKWEYSHDEEEEEAEEKTSDAEQASD